MRKHKPSKERVSYRAKQPDLFSPDSEQIKQHHLAQLKQLCEEFKTKLKAKVSNQMETWEEFKRYQRWDSNALDFYGCVDKDGSWFDSSDSFEIAVHWCCLWAGQFNLSKEGEIQWMATEGCKRGYSVIHGTMIKQMYEKGLIK